MKRLTSHDIALTFAEKFQSEYPNTPIYKLMEELRITIDDHVQQVKSVDLANVVGRSEQLPEYELGYCENCMQMTNHLNGICQKCK